MTIYLLVLAILFEGEIHVFQYGNGREPVQFKSKEACEAELVRQRDVEVPKLLAKTQTATLQAIRCLERKVDGV